MVHKDRIRKTVIKNSPFNNLSVSLDFETDAKDKFPVLLFTPDMSNLNNHFHIELSVEEASH